MESREDTSPQSSPSPATLPLIKAILDCPKEIRLDREATIRIIATYEGIISDGNAHADAPELTFNTSVFDSTLQLDRLRPDRGGEWEEIEGSSGCCGFMLVDAPPSLVSVAEHPTFSGVSPEQSIEAYSMYFITPGGWSELPADAKAGDRFRYRFAGVEVQWWDWGGKEAHGETRVWLPCWGGGPVLQAPPRPDAGSDECRESHNGGRPRFKIGPAEPVEFVIIE